MKFKFCSNCCKIHTNSVAVKIDNVFTSSYCEKNRNHLVMHICEKVRCNLPVCFEGKNPIKRSLQLPTEKKIVKLQRVKLWMFSNTTRYI